MEIIRRGEDPKKKPLREKCDNCHTIIRFTKDEATFRYDQRDGNYYEIKCPVCNSMITIADD